MGAYTQHTGRLCGQEGQQVVGQFAVALEQVEQGCGVYGAYGDVPLLFAEPADGAGDVAVQAGVVGLRILGQGGLGGVCGGVEGRHPPVRVRLCGAGFCPLS